MKKIKHLLKTKSKKVYNTKTLNRIAREHIKINDKEIGKELAEKLNNPYFFTKGILEIGFKINSESHNANHTISILTNTPNYASLGIETIYIKKKSYRRWLLFKLD